MLVDDRVSALVSARFYYPGQGDPVLSDRGMVWYDVPEETAQFGESSRDANGIAKLELVAGIGLVCRAFLVETDTRLTQFATGTGTWEERYPATGSPLKYRLWQVDTSADLAWSAQTTYHLPAEPDFAVSVAAFDSPPDHNASSYPPYIRVEWGVNLTSGWAVLFRRDVGNFLLRRVLGTWTPVLELPVAESAGYQDRQDVWLVVRHLGGKLCLSLDGGRTYVVHAPVDGNLVTAPAAPLTVRGQGCAAGFGVHQLVYTAGTFTSPVRGADRTRAVATALVFDDSRVHLPAGTAINWADLSTPTAGQVRYSATLTPATVLATPFTFHRTPVLQATQAEYPWVVNPLTGLGTYETPFDGQVLSLSLQKRLRLEESAATLVCRKDAATAFSTAISRRQKVAFLLGHTLTDGTFSLAAAWVGYLRKVRVSESRYGESRVEMEFENAAIRFRESTWTEFTRRPLGGQTPNAALTQILASEGLGSAYGTWHAAGDLVTLPVGTAREPFEFPRPGESKWDTMTRIAGYVGTEVVPLDDGGFATLPRDYVAPSVTQELDLTDPSDGYEHVEHLGLELDYSESATAVLVAAESAAGEALLAFGYDAEAEQNVFSPRFSPWRVTVRESLDDPATAGICNLRALALARDMFPLRSEPTVTTPVNLTLARRDRVRIRGSNSGATVTDEWVVLTLEHQYGPHLGELRTQVGLRRLS